MHVTGGWYGIPTSVTGEVATQLTNTSDRPMTFTLKNMWESTCDTAVFSPEAATLKAGSARSVSPTNPSVVVAGPVAPGATINANMTVTIQEPGKDSGYTKVVGTEQGTSTAPSSATHIINW